MRRRASRSTRDNKDRKRASTSVDRKTKKKLKSKEYSDAEKKEGEKQHLNKEKREKDDKRSEGKAKQSKPEKKLKSKEYSDGEKKEGEKLRLNKEREKDDKRSGGEAKQPKPEKKSEDAKKNQKRAVTPDKTPPPPASKLPPAPLPPKIADYERLTTPMRAIGAAFPTANNIPSLMPVKSTQLDTPEPMPVMQPVAVKDLIEPLKVEAEKKKEKKPGPLTSMDGTIFEEVNAPMRPAIVIEKQNKLRWITEAAERFAAEQNAAERMKHDEKPDEPNNAYENL